MSEWPKGPPPEDHMHFRDGEWRKNDAFQAGKAEAFEGLSVWLESKKVDTGKSRFWEHPAWRIVAEEVDRRAREARGE